MAFSNQYRKQDPLAIRPGELRHSIQVLAPSTTGDSFGQSVTPATWTLQRTTHAAIYTAGGKETSQASQIVSEVSHVVKVRWAPTFLGANYRVVFGELVFIVQYVENVLERNRVQLLYCLKVDGGDATMSIVPGPTVAHGVISGPLEPTADPRVFTLPGGVAPVQISIFSAGQFMTPDGDAPDYVRSGTTITFTVAPEEGVPLHAEGFY